MTQAMLLEEIAELLDREHEAIVAVDIDALDLIQLEREALVALLTPGAGVERVALAAVETRRARNERTAATAAAQLGSAMGRVGRGRTMLVGYSPIAGSIPLSRALDREV